ncbi:glucose-1-phosphate adenylyltransferase subunit GlgD [Propionigenium maris DSM 9537]|uniref:Glucose-1-phosphate adenylyltransferase subunit GlgD n=1 Tax=Propionigenium maris DSM 9537 TaxID=1123000 RepID=A0A9W6GP56_9FUSO|nr:glucose-1-phosphate adenylyltransferase subunit GlgD [Propionigenium maris]GLI57177.1 glucose-1-phosphate adenylyltransferase subunit GlgD [Propionigenium maris DSM 9537]
MLNNYMGVLLLGEDDTDIRGLTKNRSIASIPIGGRYRVIDFALSNLTNAGVTNIGLYTKKINSRSLVDHLGDGSPWDLDRKRDGLFLFHASGATEGGITDVTNLKNNLEYLYRSKQEHVIVATSYMVCNMNLKEMIRVHEESGADITMAYKTVDNADIAFENCDTVKVGEDNNIIGIGKNLHFRKRENISMETFILSKEHLIRFLGESTQGGEYKNIRDLLTVSRGELVVKGYEFDGYLKCINSTKQYYDLNMDILDGDIRRDLFFKNGRIFTKIKDTPPTKFTTGSKVTNSLVANGSLIDGRVTNSVVARHVRIEEGAEIENCIILQDCKIGKDAKLKNVIIDKNTVINSGEELKAAKEFPLVIEKKVGISTEAFRELYWPLEDI